MLKRFDERLLAHVSELMEHLFIRESVHEEDRLSGRVP